MISWYKRSQGGFPAELHSVIDYTYSVATEKKSAV